MVAEGEQGVDSPGGLPRDVVARVERFAACQDAPKLAPELMPHCLRHSHVTGQGPVHGRSRGTNDVGHIRQLAEAGPRYPA